MGILSSYTENGTKLKSLKFGNDNSFTAEPFIQTPIPSDTEVVTKPKTSLAAYVGEITRGSLISIQRSATDVLRLTKYMASPSGIQFTLKQNLLSRVSPETEASGKFLNEGIYTPLSTLAQAGVGILGIHLNKQGLLPTSLKKYGEVVYELGQDNPNTKVTNRLIKFHHESIQKSDSFSWDTLYSYKGGPGSVLGLGKTYIQYATKGDGVTPQRLMGSNGLNPKSYLVPGGKDPINLPSVDNYKLKEQKEQLSELSYFSHNKSIYSILKSNNRELLSTPIFDLSSGTFVSHNKYSTVPLGTYDSSISINVGLEASKEQDADKKHTLHVEGKNYLANLDKNVGYYETKNGNISSISHRHARNIGPDFRKTNRNIRGFGDANDSGSYYDKVTQSSEWYDNPTNSNIITVDKIYYNSGTKRISNSFAPNQDHDLINFSIEIISPTKPSETLRFRAYIDNFSDSYNPEWNSQTYMGRGEKFYKYNSFDRKISLGFTVAAEGEHHLGDMYGHLNTLASSLAPTYTTSGYMAGNLHRLTVGNYVADQYGIITGMTYDIIEESPWDIKSGKQLPMYIKVTGFQFTPIHNFRPEYGTSGKFINQSHIKYSPNPSPPIKKPNTSGTTDSGLKPVIFNK